MKQYAAAGMLTVVAFASLCAMADAIDGVVPEGQYKYKWERSDDYGNFQNGTVQFDGKPFVYRTTLDKPGFVRLRVNVIGLDGQVVRRKFNGDKTTPEGRAAYYKFKEPGDAIFFDGGAGFDVDSLAAPEEVSEESHRCRRPPLNMICEDN